MDNDKLQKRIQKLLALAERGVGGEKANAQRMLEKLLEKHNISLDDLTGDDRKECMIKYGGKVIYKRLVCQIIWKVFPEADIYKVKGYNSEVFTKLTDFEKAEVEMQLSIYKSAWEKELEETFVAFIHRHNLQTGSESDDDEDIELSDEERAKYKRIAAKMMTMNHVSINPALSKL